MKESKIFVTQLPARRENNQWVPIVDITPAKEFGDIVVMLPSGINYPDTNSVKEQLIPQLEEFGEEDFLLPLGDPLVMTVATALVARKGFFKILRWDRQSRRYFSFEV